jgi:ABC-type multidrug transport system fused ATPase/permease subunit
LESKVNITLARSVWRLYRRLSTRRRHQLFGLFGLSVFGAIAEVGTIGAVVPFLGFMVDPTVAEHYPLFRSVFIFGGWRPDKSVLLPATVLFVFMAFGTGLVRLVLTWALYRFTFGVGVDLGKEIYRRTLLQPYSYHVAHNSSQTLGSLSKVQSVVGGVISPLMQSAVSGLFVLAIGVALLFASTLVSVLTSLTFVAIYWFITLLTRKRLNRNSEIIGDMEMERVQAIQEGLGGIRDVILDGSQDLFVNRYWDREARERRAMAGNSFMSFAPRYMIESLGMIIFSVLAYELSVRGGGVSGSLPILGALALGAQRALPQIQLMYFGWASINGARSALNDVVSLLELSLPVVAPGPESWPLNFEESIDLEDVDFRYAADGRDVLSRINLTIKRGTRIGFVGRTGSGKSTLVDLIMGLLEPTRGQIRIDGLPLSAAVRRRWQATIGHVPQSIYLADATIAENIAFGREPRSIDRRRVREAAQRAELIAFVDSLPEAFDTVVGERGVRLSGGQRQRIGLARAFYKRANIIVLDEATSALDNETEAVVMNAIYSSSRDVTVLIIAHRLTTLRTCDRILELSKGRIVRECLYEDLTESKAIPAAGV